LTRQQPYTKDGAADDEQLYVDWPEISTCGPLDNIVKEEKIDALRECIDALPNRKKQVVILRDVEGLSYGTIAKKVAMPLSTVGVTLHRVRKDLRECVELKLLR
jgi:RNA polymerase sigma factor (sigma-70 family)